MELNLNEIFNNNDLDTVHSAERDSTYFIKITENAINIYKNQLIIQRAQRHFTAQTTNYFYTFKSYI